MGHCKGQIEDGVKCMCSGTGSKKLEWKKGKKNLHGEMKEMFVGTGQSQRPCDAVQPSNSHRGQNSIPLPLLSFATFVPLAGAPLPAGDVSPENGLRCGVAFVGWATAVS